MLDLSIIIVSYNTAEATLACLRSIFRFTRGITFEVIVVDNGSRDHSVILIREEFPNLLLITNDGNVGFARASNEGLRCARGRYVMLLNSDTELISDALSDLVRGLDACRHVGAVGPRLIYPDGRTQPYSACREKSLRGTLKQYSIPSLGQPDLYLKGRCASAEHDVPSQAARDALCEPFDIAFYETESISGAAMIVRREVLQSVGLLDEGFFLYCEDSDWTRRIRQAGYTVACAPEIKVIHHHGASSSQNELMRETEAIKSNIRYFSKHRGQAAVIALRLGISLIMVLRMVSLDLYRTAFKRNLSHILRDWAILGCALGYRVSKTLSREE